MRADDVLVRDERDERPARPVVRAPCPAERVCGGVVRDVSDIYICISSITVLGCASNLHVVRGCFLRVVSLVSGPKLSITQISSLAFAYID